MRCLLSALLLLGSWQAAAAQAVDEGAAAVPEEIAIELGAADVKIVGPDGQTQVSTRSVFPSPVLASAQVTPKHSLELSLSITKEGSGEAVKPQQVFVVLQHRASGASAYAVGKPSRAKDAVAKGIYALSVPFSIATSQIGASQGGEYAVGLLVGDPSAARSFFWDMGVVELLLPAAASGDGAAAVDSPLLQRTVASQPTNNVKPLIHHQFRAPDKRPPAVVSTVFTTLALVPLLVVVTYVAFGMGVNFNAWPKNRVTALAATGFHLTLYALMGIYLAFWTQWTLAQTLPLVGLLCMSLALLGHRALSGLAAERLAGKKD